MCVRLFAITGKGKLQGGLLGLLILAQFVGGIWFTVVTGTGPSKFSNPVRSFTRVRVLTCAASSTITTDRSGPVQSLLFHTVAAWGVFFRLHRAFIRFVLASFNCLHGVLIDAAILCGYPHLCICLGVHRRYCTLGYFFCSEGTMVEVSGFSEPLANPCTGRDDILLTHVWLSIGARVLLVPRSGRLIYGAFGSCGTLLCSLLPRTCSGTTAALTWDVRVPLPLASDTHSSNRD